MSTSFSAMNSSLQQRWKQARETQPKGPAAGRESVGALGAGGGLSNTMAAGGASGRFKTEVGAGAQGLTSSSNAEAATAGQPGASN